MMTAGFELETYGNAAKKRTARVLDKPVRAAVNSA
jgi:hypothetical protein